mgnify:CR=1 FL=1
MEHPCVNAHPTQSLSSSCSTLWQLANKTRKAKNPNILYDVTTKKGEKKKSTPPASWKGPFFKRIESNNIMFQEKNAKVMNKNEKQTQNPKLHQILDEKDGCQNLMS